MMARLPSLLMLAVLAFLAWAMGQGERLSTARLAGLGVVLLGGLYLVASLRRPAWLAVNTLVLVNLLVLAAGSEILMRLLADRLPLALVQWLPTADRQRLLAQRGLFTAASLQGERLLYSWPAGHSVPGQPWLTVDAYGYRNPSPWPAPVDVVLLGDSVTIAQTVPDDMAARLRQAGLRSVNLGFAGYSTFHERDAYERLMVEKGVSHGVVVVNFCHCNDITDNRSYLALAALGKDWRDYLGQAPSRTAFPFPFDPPWVVSVLFNLPFVVVQAVQDRRSGERASESLPTPAGTLRLDPAVLAAKPETDAGWAATETALADIARLAAKAGARLVLAYYPGTRHIYADRLDPARRQPIEAERADALERLGRISSTTGGAVVDYTPALRARIEAGLRVAETDEDYHPNPVGVDAMVETLMPVLKGS